MVKTLLLGVLALLFVAQIIKAEIGKNITRNIKNVTEQKNETLIQSKNQIKNSLEEKLKHVETRRKEEDTKKFRSTSSSSSGEKVEEEEKDEDKESLDDSISDYKWKSSNERNEDPDTKHKPDRYEPKSTVERHGWRKYHRKCHQCLDDMKKKWRDPSINWICGGYQRARRSFKSLCMMHYRNCQDGTMFVKIHDHRCADPSPSDAIRHGQHFFYDYKVKLPDDTSNTENDEEESTSEESESGSLDVIDLPVIKK